MKRFATMIALCTSLAAAPAMADHSGGNLLSRENVGGALGAAVGGYLGNEIGDRKPAITAAGAVGGFLLGQKIAKDYGGGSHRISHASTGYSRTSNYGGGYQQTNCCNDDRSYHERIRPINETYVAKCTSNVRSGPSTRYHVVGQLRDHDRVHVVGKVEGRNWYMVRSGHRRGFVYAPLLRPAHYSSNW